MSRRRGLYRRWTITCNEGSFKTDGMKRADATLVALWCDEHFECGPHIVETRESRSWASRKEQSEQRST